MMAEFGCDSYRKHFLEATNTEYAVMESVTEILNWNALKKAGTKGLCQQTYPNISFFCSVCDSRMLKYLYDKTSQTQNSQKKNNELLPVITEMYDRWMSMTPNGVYSSIKWTIFTVSISEALKTNKSLHSSQSEKWSKSF